MTTLKKMLMLNLKQGRKSKGLSQEKLAELCGISVNHLAAIEIGRRFPSEEVFQRIADVLEVEPYQLILDPNSMEKAQEIVVLDRYTDFLMDGMKKQLEIFKKRYSKAP